MVTIKIKDGTPEGTQSLCVTCRWAHAIRGFRESQEVIHCTWLCEAPEIRFPVSRCSSYDDRRIPSRRDMEQFVTAKQFYEIEGDDAAIIPAATADADSKHD